MAELAANEEVRRAYLSRLTVGSASVHHEESP